MSWIALFVLVPLVDLMLLLFAGGWLGPWPTFAIVVLTGVVGSSLARREGVGVLQQIQETLHRGRPPAAKLVEGALVFAGGLLLLTPGFLTDLVGFAFILPPTRRAIAPAVLDAVASRVQWQTVDLGSPRGPVDPRPPRDTPPPPHPAHDPFDHPVQ